MTELLDEETLEAAFWAFDEVRRRTGAERDAFKQQVRRLLVGHLTAYCRLLEDCEIYLVATTTQHAPPGGMERARRVKQDVHTRLAAYRHHVELAQEVQP